MTELMDEQNTEQRLLEKAKRGDRQAFDGLIALYEEDLASFILTRVGSQLRKKVEVRDLVQDVMLTAYRSLSEFEPKDQRSFLRWLCGIAQNRILHLARHHFRNREFSIEREIVATAGSPSGSLRREERFDRLEAALEKLSPEYRQVIILARIDGLPLKDISERMNRTPKAVSKLLRRALENLKSHFGDTESFSLPHRTFSERRKSQ